MKTNTGLAALKHVLIEFEFSASARASVKSTAALSAKASSVPPAPPLSPSMSNPRAPGSTQSVGRFTVTTVKGRKIGRHRSAKKKHASKRQHKRSSRRRRRSRKQVSK